MDHMSVKLRNAQVQLSAIKDRIMHALMQGMLHVCHYGVYSFGIIIRLLRPVSIFLALESLQLTLELVTLAGDCGVAPGGVALALVWLAWVVRGPCKIIATFCGICLGLLKFCEHAERAEPMTPKKVMERGLENYSPLNGRAAVHTRDHVPGEYESRLFTAKRVRALIVFILLLYAAVCVQGCTFPENSNHGFV